MGMDGETGLRADRMTGGWYCWRGGASSCCSGLLRGAGEEEDTIPDLGLDPIAPASSGRGSGGSSEENVEEGSTDTDFADVMRQLLLDSSSQAPPKEKPASAAAELL